MRLLFCLLLITACGDNPENKNPEQQKDDGAQQTLKAPLPFSPPNIKECAVSDTLQFKDCTVYTLICEDGSSELFANCHFKPIGIITNPPRPI